MLIRAVTISDFLSMNLAVGDAVVGTAASQHRGPGFKSSGQLDPVSVKVVWVLCGNSSLRLS